MADCALTVKCFRVSFNVQISELHEPLKQWLLFLVYVCFLYSTVSKKANVHTLRIQLAKDDASVVFNFSVNFCQSHILAQK